MIDVAVIDVVFEPEGEGADFESRYGMIRDREMDSNARHFIRPYPLTVQVRADLAETLEAGTFF